MPITIVRIAHASECENLTALYRRWGYNGSVAATDTVFVAERAGEAVGIVRRTIETEITMLRGMWISPDHRRTGVGSLLLAAFVAHLPGTDCYCTPFEHLVAFYAQGGFQRVSAANIPEFLAHRLREYRAIGHDVTVMCRPEAL